MNNNELKVINEQEVLGKQFRIYGDFDNPLFLAKDVANWIEHNKPSEMIHNIDEEEKLKAIISLSGQNREVWLLTEDGLYEILMQSRKPIAKQFKLKVKIILKTLRKTGGYISNSELMVNTYFGSLDDNNKIIIRGLFENIEAQQKEITLLKDKNITLDKENDLLTEKVLEWADRNFINASVRKYSIVCDNFGEAWNDFKKELLYKHSINLNQRITNYLNKTGKKTKPKTLDMLHDEEVPSAVSTIVSLCRDNDIDISDLIKKLSEEVANCI